MKNKIKQNQQLVKPNQVSTKNVLNANINIKKNFKKTLFLISLYVLAFSATTVTTLFLLDNNITYNNMQFNPDANNSLWNDYYQHHNRDYQPIDLTNTKAYFAEKKNFINCAIVNNSPNNNIDFSIILSSIDNNLQTAQPKPLEENNDNNHTKLLPFNFFLNVRYNPAANFMLVDSSGKKMEVTNDSFKLPAKYNDNNDYLLNFTTNNEATAFGLANNDINFNIHIKVINQIAIDISKLPLSFSAKTIAIAHPENATIDSIKDKWLIPGISDEFKTVLSQALNITKDKLSDDYYNIVFLDSGVVQNFTKPVNVKFTINSIPNNPWHFFGKYDGNCEVKNDFADLSKLTTLTAAIEKQYNTGQVTKDLQVTVDNRQAGNHNLNNADCSLSNDNLNLVNQAITSDIQAVCQNYFKQNWSDLNIDTSDYVIITSLSKGDDIFNHKLGEKITINIKASATTNKLKNSLENIKAVVHGHNKNNIYEEYSSPNNFALNGIWLRDGEDKDVLQDDEHFYEQNNLFKNWVSNQDSLLNNINNDAYNPVANSFSGNFVMNYQLGTSAPANLSADIAKDINNGKAINFWDLISNTKSIYLETNVQQGLIFRKLTSVKLIFYSSLTNSPNPNDILYSFDLSSKLGGKVVVKGTKLQLPTFTFNINYEQAS